MKSVLIISLRGAHTDYLPAYIASTAIQHIKTAFPAIPLTFCFEADPLDPPTAEIVRYKINNNLSRFVNRPYSENEKNFDKSMVLLLSTINKLNVKTIFTDLPDMNHIPLGNKQAELKRAQREKHMADELIKIAANEEGGIILDFGGVSHIPGIQKHLMEHNLFSSDQKPSVYFFCTYSSAGENDLTLEEKGMLLNPSTVSKDKYPLGFLRLSDSLPGENYKKVVAHINDIINAFANRFSHITFTNQEIYDLIDNPGSASINLKKLK
jgi:hypothetical protein